MKKSLIITLMGCLAVFCLTTAFDDGNTTKADQMQRIGDMLNERLDAYRIAKEQECKDRAIAAAVVRADEEMVASKSTKKRVRRKPTYTTKGSDTTPTTTTTTATPPPPPPPPPANNTPPSTTPTTVDKAVEKAADNVGKKTDAVKREAKEIQRKIEKKATNTGKKRGN